MSFGKGSSKQSSQQNVNTTQQQQQSQSQEQQQQQYQGETQTPNNLAALQAGWNAASGILNGAYNPAVAMITGNAANASNAANAGLGAAAGLAAPGATANGANGYLTPFANGSFSGDNPYFRNLIDQISRGAQQSTDGDFAASGRYGSGANANAFNSAVANTTGQLGYQNYSDSLNRQLQGAQQLSTNNTNSTNAALAALGLIPQLGAASTGAGQAAFEGAAAPLNTYANILSLFGPGGGSAEAIAQGAGSASGSASGNSSGNQNGTSSGQSSSSNWGIDLGNLIKPFNLFGGK
jgi:hypothetical protein